MTDQEKEFFKALEEKSAENPVVRVRAASDYVVGSIRQRLTTKKGIPGDLLCYMIATLTGLCVADTAKKKFLSKDEESKTLSMAKAETVAGISIWMGDTVNKYLYNSPMSLISIVMRVYSNAHDGEKLIDIKELFENNIKIVGAKDVKLWAGFHDPYQELAAAIETYKELFAKLEPYKLLPEEYLMAFSMALINTILAIESYTPEDIDCLKLSLEAAIFYAHMDV